MQEGERVERTGIARLVRDPVVAPLTGEPCVAHVSVARVFTQLDHLGDFVDEIEVIEVAPFMLDGPGGLVFAVDRPGRVVLPRMATYPHPVAALRFLERRGLAQYARSSFFEHGVIRAGARISVAGVITGEAAPALEAGFRDASMRTRLPGYGRHPLTLRCAR